MTRIITTAPYVLTLLLCADLSYGQDNSRLPPKQTPDLKLYREEVKDLPNFTRYDYARSPRDPFLDKSVKATIMGAYKPSVLDKLVLVSWLDDAGKTAIFVQNTETNDVQKITFEPNKDNFRIVEIHPNADPKLFEAVISNGTEKGPVKFRLMPPNPNPQIGTTSPPAAQTKNPPIETVIPRVQQKKN
jgi:hypothetical protein